MTLIIHMTIFVSTRCFKTSCDSGSAQHTSWMVPRHLRTTSTSRDLRPDSTSSRASSRYMTLITYPKFTGFLDTSILWCSSPKKRYGTLGGQHKNRGRWRPVNQPKRLRPHIRSPRNFYLAKLGFKLRSTSCYYHHVIITRSRPKPLGWDRESTQPKPFRKVDGHPDHNRGTIMTP